LRDTAFCFSKPSFLFFERFFLRFEPTVPLQIQGNREALQMQSFAHVKPESMDKVMVEHTMSRNPNRSFLGFVWVLGSRRGPAFFHKLPFSAGERFGKSRRSHEQLNRSR
jgi:hypothetical protein